MHSFNTSHHLFRTPDQYRAHALGIWSLGSNPLPRPIMSSPPADTQTTAYAALPQHFPPCVLHFRPIPSLCTQYLAVGPKSPSHGRSCHPACRYPNYRIRSMLLTLSTPPTMCFALQTNTERMLSIWPLGSNPPPTPDHVLPACRYPNYRIRNMQRTTSTPPAGRFASQTNTERTCSVSGLWAQILLLRPIMSSRLPIPKLPHTRHHAQFFNTHPQTFPSPDECRARFAQYSVFRVKCPPPLAILTCTSFSLPTSPTAPYTYPAYPQVLVFSPEQCVHILF
jgi:hypothetical protein